MTRSHSFTVIAMSLVSVLYAMPAQALVARTFVSAAGSDSNNCANVATPCRHLAAAFAATAPNGEIYVLDPANYGSVIITHGVSIEGHGWASIAPVSGGPAINISAQPSDVVNIIGVVIDGAGFTNTTGIVFYDGGTVTIQDSVIRNVTGDGIDVLPANNPNSSISVSNTFVANNGGYGILVQPVGNVSVTATFDHVRAQYNGPSFYGIELDSHLTTGTVNGTATDTVSSNNGGGFFANAGASLMLVRSTAAHNHTGVQNLASTIYLSQTTITNSVLSCFGIIESFGDNNLDTSVPVNCTVNTFSKF